MKCSDIHIRDPFILTDDGKYYMYGSRAKNFAMKSGGFDVYVSDNLENWSEPTECFNSEKFNMNRGANWAPEVHKYGDKYYMFATFTKEDNLRGTYILRADSPKGPFVPHSDGGHGMIFKKEDKLYRTFHSPNTANFERPHFTEIIDNGDTISLNYI